MAVRNLALAGAMLVSLIYGLTFTVAKDVMPAYIGAFGFIVYRVGGSVLLFWLVWFFIPKQRIQWGDIPRIIAAAFFGVAFNMLTFFKGLSLTSPISAAVIMVATPVIVLLLSALLLREKLFLRKIFGILLGLAGTIFLILYGKSVGSSQNANWGNLLVFVNAVSYGLYLIIVKKLMDKYNPLMFVQWIYTVGFLMVIPFGWQEAQAVSWQNMPARVFMEVLFVVVFSTFLTYLLNLLSMKALQPSTVAVFIYLQPLFATVFAIGLGKDHLTLEKIVAAIVVFSGVYLVTIPQKAVV